MVKNYELGQFFSNKTDKKSFVVRKDRSEPINKLIEYQDLFQTNKIE